MITKKELKFLKELNKLNVKYIIVGLSAANLQGAPCVTYDIDLWLEDITDPNFKKALAKVGATYVPPIGLNPPMIAGGGVELFDIVLTVHGLKNFKEEFKNILWIDLEGMKIPTLSLAKIIKSKKYLNRPKDKAVLPILEETLFVLKHQNKK